MSAMGKGSSGQPVSEQPGETYLTLEPIRSDGPDALDPTGIPEIVRPTLREIEITWKTSKHRITIYRADDLLDCGTLHSGLCTCRVTYTGGYVLPGDTPAPGQTPLPADLEHSAIEQTAEWFQNRDKLGLIRQWPHGGVYEVLSQLPPY